MSSRMTRILAAAVTAIVLVLIGIVVANRSGSTATGPAPANTAPQTTSATLSPAESFAVSSDQAGSIALASSPGATITGAPMLVTYQGAVVYEVALDTGMVYVDATSGQVVANTAATSATAASGGAPGAQSGGEGGEGDNGDDGDDD